MFYEICFAYLMKLLCNQIQKKNFNQKTKSSFRSKYRKSKNFCAKLLIWISSFDQKEASVQVYEILCRFDEVIEVQKTLTKC